MGIIRFYTTKDTHGYMSNFARYQIEVFGRIWMTSEHAYQAQKFSGMNQEDYDAVFGCNNPMGAAITGRDEKRICRPDWEDVKADVMRFVVLHKFLQHADIQEKLLTTGDDTLVEHDPKRKDPYWADGGDGTGKNMLGVILMEVREILREELKFRNEFPESTTSGPVSVYLISLKLGGE